MEQDRWGLLSCPQALSQSQALVNLSRGTVYTAGSLAQLGVLVSAPGTGKSTWHGAHLLRTESAQMCTESLEGQESGL